MKQWHDQDQHPEIIRDAWSAAWGDPALQDLGRRLDSYGVLAEQAALVVEQTWLFYSYEALPLLGERLPMGIVTRAADRPAIWLYLPVRTDESPFDSPVAGAQFRKLNRVFVRKFEVPLAEHVAMDLKPIPVGFEADFGDSWTVHRFESRVADAARDNMDFVGIFVDNLIAELMTVMDHESVSSWLDTPNTLFGGRRPIDLVDDPRDQQLRDVITRAKFNLSVA